MIQAIRSRIEIARGAFSSLSKTLTSRDISKETILRIVKCYVWSTLMYGCETWTLTKQTINRLQAFEMWVYRKILKIPWSAKKTNEEVLKMLKIKKYVVPTIEKRKTIYFGHMIRRDNIQRMLVEGRVEGKRCKGRPRTEWTTNLHEWTQITSYEEMIRKAQNRERWRIVAVNLHNEEDT